MSDRVPRSEAEAARQGDSEVFEVVITGGPAGGKSSSLATLQQELADRGFRVLAVPEVATMMIEGGLQDLGRLAKEDFERFLELEEELFAIQRSLRERFRAVAKRLGEPTVILFDRGELDIAAYTGMEEFQALCDRADISLTRLRDSYDAVIHLVSVARGPTKEYYTTANNPARWESPEEAAEADLRTLRAWWGSPRLRVIDNSSDFETKLRRATGAVLAAIGAPSSTEHERRFLLKEAPDTETPPIADAEVIGIEQAYLTGEEEVRISKRSQHGGSTHFLTRRQSLPDGERYELVRHIDALEYRRLFKQRDDSLQVIRKTRYCFVHENRYFELDRIPSGSGEIWILEAKLGSAAEELEMPPGLALGEEITADETYLSPAIAGGSLAIEDR